ncbi:MAG TPA: hypothetical protein VF185_02810 [Patescibacteria group bacterium]
MWNKIVKYFSKHVTYSAFVHAIGGAGVGIILARPIDAAHPVRLGVLLIAVSILGHVVPIWSKK